MLAIQKVLGLATVQDLGRVGFASHAVPRGGALVRALARRANAALGNDEGAACLEIFGRAIFICEEDVRIATEDGVVRSLRVGEEFTIDPIATLRARYLAIENGIDAPRVLGSRSTLLACGIGRALRAGDRITPCAMREKSRAHTTQFDAAGPVRIVIGPDFPDVGAMLARTWRISTTSDRAGTRLEGARIEHDLPASLPSSPMVPGTIQLPPSGLPIVIGPDGPTTGGYAIAAVIAREDLDRFHARPLGASLTFEIA